MMIIPAQRRMLAVLLALNLLVPFMVAFVATLDRTPEDAQSAAPPASAPQEAMPCPGVESAILATGVYRSEPVPEVVINGEPWGGAFWEAGMRSYWHCHRNGQILVMWEGEGQYQERGERVRVLRRGEMAYGGPWVEHWHGSSPHSDAQWLMVSPRGPEGQAGGQPGLLWMEEVSDEDFLGNDVGINSRNEYLRTKIQQKYPNRFSNR